LAVITLLADRAPGLLKILRENDPDYVLLDGTLAECDRVTDGRADYSHKYRRHGVNVQVVTDPTGHVLWISPALPGRAHDVTTARAHRIIRIIRIRERPGVAVPGPGARRTQDGTAEVLAHLPTVARKPTA
jgi:hypothetical protein